MSGLNPLVTGIEAPPIMAAHGWAARYNGEHGAPLDLCQAVPGWAPHDGLLARLAAEAGAPGNARYGLIDGDLALRQAYAAEVSDVYGGRVAPGEVAITAGCNQAFFLAMLTLARADDAVLLPLPWFWNHQQTCTMLGIEARPLPCRPEDHFVPDPAVAERLIDDRVRAIVLITPNNPTGAVYPPDVIMAFADLCRRRGIFLIVDETYRDFLPAGQERAHGLFERPDWADYAMQLYSFSKAYCVPGARMGAVVAGTPLVEQFVKVLDCLHICPQRPAQAALAWAIGALAEWRATNRREVNARAASMRAALAGLAGWRVDSLGAYFAYVRHPFEGVDGAAVAERLATEFGAVCLPGSAFGPEQERYLRLAFATLGLTGVEALSTRLRGWVAF